MTQSKSTPVQGLIEGLREVARYCDAAHDDAIYEAISTLTRLEAEVGRLREALVLVDKLSQKPEGDMPGLNLSTCGLIARAALNPQEPTHER